jgi:hypothetical protein
VLLDGRVVAVKLQYPDARRLILTDLGNIHRVLRALGKKAEAGVVREYRSRMAMEFDYEAEASTMNAVAAFFDPRHRDGAVAALPPRPSVGSSVVVPRCHVALSTRRLLVMDFVPGTSLRDSLRSQVAAASALPYLLRVPRLLSIRSATKRRLRTLLEAQGAQIFTLGTFNADPVRSTAPLPCTPLAYRPSGIGPRASRVAHRPSGIGPQLRPRSAPRCRSTRATCFSCTGRQASQLPSLASSTSDAPRHSRPRSACP